MKFIFPLFCVILLTGCMDQTKLEYADGNGNRYIITSTILQYVPVTPETSSSGTYSGGEAKVITLHDAQHKAINKLLQDAIGNKAIHVENRVMGTGLILKDDGSGSEKWIIRGDAPEKERIEGLLREFLEPKI